MPSTPTPESTRAAHRMTRDRSFRGPIAPVLGDWAVLDNLYTGQHTEVAKAVPLRNSDECENEYVVKYARRNSELSRISACLVRRECELLNGLDHPHVVSILDSGDHEQTPYFVMPFVGQLTLADWIQRSDQLSLVEIVWAIRQASEGLNYLHRLGLCHLDLKPQNIVIGTSGHVTIVDLGFAQPIGNHQSTAPFVGSRNYVAPERIRHCRIVNPAADIYALGILLQQLLIGLEGANETSAEPADGGIRPSRRIGRRHAIQAAHPALPISFISYIERMVASIPERRPSSDEVVEFLWRHEIELFQP